MKSNRVLPFFKHPLLTLAVCGIPAFAAFLASILTDPRDLMFAGFCSGCAMTAIIFARR